MLALFGEEFALEAPAPSPEPKATADADLTPLDEELAALFGDEPAAVVPPPIEDSQAADRVFDEIVDEMVAEFSVGEDKPEAPVTFTPEPAFVSGQAEVDELERAFVEAQIAEAQTPTTVPAPATTWLPVDEDAFVEYGDDFNLGVAPGPSRLADEVVPPAPVVEEVSLATTERPAAGRRPPDTRSGLRLDEPASEPRDRDPPRIKRGPVKEWVKQRNPADARALHQQDDPEPARGSGSSFVYRAVKRATKPIALEPESQRTSNSPIESALKRPLDKGPPSDAARSDRQRRRQGRAVLDDLLDDGSERR